MKLTRHENRGRGPLSVVWTAEKGGRTFRIAREETGPGWAVDRLEDFIFWVRRGSFPDRAGAVAALAALRPDKAGDSDLTV